MALIRRGTSGPQYRDPFGRLFDWPELLRPFPPLRSLLADEHIRVEEFMDGDTLVIRAELPGIDPDKDVDITMSDGLLHIQAERRQETGRRHREGRHGHLQGRRPGGPRAGRPRQGRGDQDPDPLGMTAGPRPT